MNYEKLWEKIILKLSYTEEELQTKTGLWFKAYTENNKIIITSADKHTPSSKIVMKRRIAKKYFLLVGSYYDRWISGEKNIRQEVRNISVNTSYIFALISKFE